MIYHHHIIRHNFNNCPNNCPNIDYMTKYSLGKHKLMTRESKLVVRFVRSSGDFPFRVGPYRNIRVMEDHLGLFKNMESWQRVFPG